MSTYGENTCTQTSVRSIEIEYSTRQSHASNAANIPLAFEPMLGLGVSLFGIRVVVSRRCPQLMRPGVAAPQTPEEDAEASEKRTVQVYLQGD